MKLDIIVRDGVRRIRLTIEDEDPAIETTGESVDDTPTRSLLRLLHGGDAPPSSLPPRPALALALPDRRAA